MAQKAIVTIKPQSDSSAVLLVRRAGKRHGFLLHNDAGAALFLRFGDDAAAAGDYSVRVPGDWLYEYDGEYQGAVAGIWAAAGAGLARMTEILE